MWLGILWRKDLPAPLDSTVWEKRVKVFQKGYLRLRDLEGVGARCGACESKGVHGQVTWCLQRKAQKPIDGSNRKEDTHPLQQVSFLEATGLKVKHSIRSDVIVYWANCALRRKVRR